MSAAMVSAPSRPGAPVHFLDLFYRWLGWTRAPGQAEGSP